MTGSNHRLVELVHGPGKRFAIPVYQRNYEWKKENCQRLFDDLVKVVRKGLPTHFFGSVVYMQSPQSAASEFFVIDGQQRITTVSLLLLAMRNLIAAGAVAEESEYLERLLYKEYLVNRSPFDDTDTQFARLDLVKKDRIAYTKLFFDASEHVKDSNLTLNYDYFYNRIQEQEVTVEELYGAIQALDVIAILLGNNDDPQAIFESLNSTGLGLTEGDRIRNYIFMDLSPADQERLYGKYWSKIELATGYDVTPFIRDYLSVKRKAIPQQSRIYLHFKDHAGALSLSKEQLLREMLGYARRYQMLMRGSTGSRALDACIFRMNHLETTTPWPFFLEVLKLHDDGDLSMDQVTDIFLTVESFVFRRIICDLPTNSLNKIFLTLHHDIVGLKGPEASYVDRFKYALLSKKGRARFPDDKEFSESFARKPVYRMNSKNRIYILERLENAGTREDKDVYQRCEEGVYSIEHIMPQHLTPIWQKELGPDYDRVHSEWLHRIANLTLTAYNSKYGDSPFADKKVMDNGFRDSGIRLNGWIAQQDKWTESELEARSHYLTTLALKVWPSPATRFRPERRELDACTLEDEEDLTGRSIAGFAYKDARMPVRNWADMFGKAIRMLYEEDKGVIRGLAVSGKGSIGLQFSTNPETLVRSTEIGDGIYVLTRNNTKSKLAGLRRLFSLHDADPADLVFYLKDESESASGESSGRAHQKAYWNQALPVIREALGKDASSSRTEPKGDSWTAGSAGISGFSIICIANNKGARVEIAFRRGDQGTNKRAFDLLAARKEEIENALGAPLTWDRKDGRKTSKIYKTLSGVDVADEDDWSEMTQFQAEWCRKLNDVVVPFVVQERDALLDGDASVGTSAGSSGHGFGT